MLTLKLVLSACFFSAGSWMLSSAYHNKRRLNEINFMR